MLIPTSAYIGSQIGLLSLETTYFYYYGIIISLLLQKLTFTMGKQVVATVRFPNSANTEERSFLSDLLLIKENLADEDYPATLFFFGNLSNPLQPTEKWLITETVAEIATSDNGLVLGTVTAINNSGQTTTVEYAFPCAGYTIKSTSVAYAESIINYRGLDYFVEETQAELVDAANAGDGGGGDTLFALTGSNTATGAVIGDLDGNSITVESDGHTYFSISPEAGSEGVGLGARNTTGDGNIASLAANVTDTTTQVIVNADFNDGVNLSTITANANVSESSIVYSSGVHTFNGTFNAGGTNSSFTPETATKAAVFNGNGMTVQDNEGNDAAVTPTNIAAGSVAHSGAVGMFGLVPPAFEDATERDSVITSPSIGALVTTTGALQIYKVGGWQTISSS